MKRKVMLITLLVCGLIGCSKKEASVFEATVLEVNNGTLLVEPVEGSQELNSSDQIVVSMKNMASLPEPEIGDTVEIEYNGEIAETYPAQISGVYGIKVVKEAEKWDLIPMVMVNGELYLDTGCESTMNGRCGVMDGKITSEVDGSEKPSVDDQSNFGAGYGYQYGATEGTIEVYMNGEWRIFAVEDVQQQMQFPKEDIVIGSLDSWGLTFTVKDVTPSSLTFVCTQSGGEPTGELQTGSRFILGKWDEENGWQEMPMKCEAGWTDEANFIPKDETTEFEITWEWLYGKLPAGKYIVGKEIMDFREADDYDTCNCYAEFDITE